MASVPFKEIASSIAMNKSSNQGVEVHLRCGHEMNFSVQDDIYLGIAGESGAARKKIAAAVADNSKAHMF